MSKFLKYAFLIIFFCGNLSAQDLHFSQFPWSPLNLGASEAGNMDADFRMSGIHRRQWASVTTPYQTFAFGFDCKLSAFSDKLKSWGAGILINHDKAGDGDLQTLNINLALSYSFALNADSTHFIHLGVSGGITQKDLDQSKLTFDDQFNGDVFIPASPNGEIFDRTHFINPDAGVSISYTFLHGKSKWDAGIQLLHLNQPDQSFLQTEKIKLPMLTQLHASNSYKINEQLTLMPALNLMLQQKFKELNFGIEARFQLHSENSKKYAVGAGLFMRTNDAIIPMVSLYMNKFRIGFSYDINTSSLKNASNGKGGPEISLVYMSKKIRANNLSRSICPVY